MKQTYFSAFLTFLFIRFIVFRYAKQWVETLTFRRDNLYKIFGRSCSNWRFRISESKGGVVKM